MKGETNLRRGCKRGILKSKKDYKKKKKNGSFAKTRVLR